jgi:hypothetical protein
VGVSEAKKLAEEATRPFLHALNPSRDSSRSVRTDRSEAASRSAAFVRRGGGLGRKAAHSIFGAYAPFLASSAPLIGDTAAAVILLDVRNVMDAWRRRTKAPSPSTKTSAHCCSGGESSSEAGKSLDRLAEPSSASVTTVVRPAVVQREAPVAATAHHTATGAGLTSIESSTPVFIRIASSPCSITDLFSRLAIKLVFMK